VGSIDFLYSIEKVNLNCYPKNSKKSHKCHRIHQQV
jgi:hypothetical protein